MAESLGEKAARATKWSMATQVASKAISPVTQMVLAHLLAPEAFGVVALANMVLSLADLFSDAGFQKYLIQHEFDSDDELYLSADVAFWTNMAVSFTLWAAISLFRDRIAALVGNASIGPLIVFACSSLPLTAAVSVQTAVYQRSFDFRTLFKSRVGSSLLIFAVSVPLAVMGASYWSIVCGTVASNLFLAVWLTVRSSWKPKFRYEVSALREMLSFSVWTLVEALSIWLTGWVGTLILGTLLDSYTVGLFNTPVSFVNATMSMVTAVIIPVSFATLSRLQDDGPRFAKAFCEIQRMLAYLLAPLGVAIFVFRDTLVLLVMGEVWAASSTLFGLQALASSVVVVFGHVASEGYRAMGKPRVSLLVQLFVLGYTIPAYIVGAKAGYEVLSVIVPMARLIGVFVHLLACWMVLKLSPLTMFGNVAPFYVASLLCGTACMSIALLFTPGTIGQCVLMAVFATAYAALSLMVPPLRRTLCEALTRLGLLRMLPKWMVEYVAQD